MIRPSVSTRSRPGSTGRLLVWVPVLVATALVLLVWGLWLNRSEDPRYTAAEWVDLNEPRAERIAEQGPGDGGSSLRLAVTPAIVPAGALESYRGLAEYLAARLGMAPVLIRRNSYAAVNNLLRYGRCDLALVCTYPFVRGERDFGLKLLAVPRINGRTEYHSLVIAPASSRVTSLLDLQGQRFASADLMSNSGWCYPMSRLLEEGRDPDHFFSEHLITGSHDQSILAITGGLADGAAVDSLVYERMVTVDPRVAEQTKVVLRSPPFGMPPLVVPSEIDPELERGLRDALLTMHEQAEGRKILESLEIDRFVAPDTHLYDSVRRLSKNLEGG